VSSRAVNSDASRRTRGFALIIVLWALVLIAFNAAHLVGTGRTELRIASNLVANAKTEAAAEGAVYQAIFNLMDPQPERRPDLDGKVREFAIGGSRLSVTFDDETARINPNLAAPALLEALFRVTGSDGETARRLSAAIGIWKGNPATTRLPEATEAEYRAAGLDYAPPGEPIESLDELQRVIGMTPDIFAAICPYLSLYAPSEPTLARSAPAVLAAMAQAGVEQPSASPQVDVLTARVGVTAQDPNNARATRIAIVQVMPLAQSYTVLSWTRPDLKTGC
jgi:general secretion pathway protein K